MATIKLIGDAPNQVSRNKDLGELAFMGKKNAILESGRIDLKGGGSNLFTYSQDFTQAIWTKTDATVASNVATAPDGTLTANTLTEGSATSSHSLSKSIDFSFPIGGYFAFSAFVKANGRTQVRLATAHGAGGGSIYVDFDLVGVTATPTGTNVTGSIVDVGNGYYRCIMSGQDNNSGNRPATISLLSGGTLSYAGDGTSGVFLWGAQIEESKTVGNYIATESTAITLENAQGTQLNIDPTTGFDTTYPMAFELASDTSLVVKVKGSDGTVRSATLTLA